tara:strand:- start:593 stop:1672 length:1080 start_codon:yes stop_codon:yes gene_type:complete
MINQRLFNHYNINTKKNLEIETMCPRPYDTILIDKMGSCYACECQSWLPQSIGNLQVKTLGEIVGDTERFPGAKPNELRKHLQDSIRDRSYRYCNEHQCSWLLAKIPFEQRVRNRPRYRIKHLRLAIDDSCNLRCPSCRKDLIFHKEGSAYDLGIKLADKINDFVNDWDHRYMLQIHMGSDGDPFASHVYRYFMETTPERDNVKYSILTNGLMFKDFHNKTPYVIENLLELGVSIDGATEKTYEQLRLGGKWEKIIENLEFMAKLKREIGFRFVLHFVVQRDNYHEMEDIIKLGKKYEADRVCLNKLQDWNVLPQFSEKNIFKYSHPQHEDYRKKLRALTPYLGTGKRPYVQLSLPDLF